MKERKEIIRNFIVEKSKELFSQHGYQNTSMDMISSTCDISKPTLYNYFSSKYELFMEVHFSIQSDIIYQIQTLMKQEKGKNQILEEIIDMVFEFTESKLRILNIGFQELNDILKHCEEHDDYDRFLEIYMTNRKRMILDFSNFFENMITPEVKKEFGAERVATIFIDLIVSMVQRKFMTEPSRGEREDKMEKHLITHLFRNGILNREV